jgi:hypothetical protein
MKLWAIIKLIAGIISALPFDATEEQITQAVDQALSDPSAMTNVGIPRSEWQELIPHIVAIIQWIIARMG